MASGGGGCAENIGEGSRSPRLAHPPHRPSPSGDQDQLADYDFVEEPAKEFLCAVTLELLVPVVEPQQTDCCGHHISAEVARRLLGEGKACPMCQQPRLTTHPDKFHGRRIRQLVVRCPNKKSGCGWEGELGDVEAHVGYCPKQPWQCLHCAFVGLWEGGEEHLRVCEQFPVVCPNRCKTGHVQHARVQQHLLDCPLEIVSCEYAEMGCGVRLPRSEMREHVRESGQDHLLKMCAANLSLSRELSRKVAEKEQQIKELHRDMRRREEKINGDMKRREEKMSGDMKRMEEKISSDMRRMEERMKENEERMNASLREREMRQQQQMKEMEEKVAMQMKMELGENERKMTVSMVEMEGRMRNRMEEREMRQQQLMKEMEAKVAMQTKLELSENERKMTVSMMEMRDRMGVGDGRTQKLLGRMEGVIEQNRKEMKVIEVINTSVVNVGRELSVVKSQVAEIRGETAVTVCIPPVEYTIHNFSVLKAQDKEWRSPPLYTHRGGYKMCIGVWPNGVGGIQSLHGNGQSYPLPKKVREYDSDIDDSDIDDYSTRTEYSTVTVTTGKGTHVSVVVYTETPKWYTDTYSGCYTLIAFEVMDQTSGRWEREYVDRSWRYKPETEYIESGVHFEYISHSELAPYLKDDCLRIRISKFSAQCQRTGIKFR